MGLGTQGAGCNGAAVGLHNKGLQLGYLKDTPVAAKEFNATKTWIQDVRERLCGCVMSVAFSKRLGYRMKHSRKQSQFDDFFSLIILFITFKSSMRYSDLGSGSVGRNGTSI